MSERRLIVNDKCNRGSDGIAFIGIKITFFGFRELGEIYFIERFGIKFFFSLNISRRCIRRKAM